MENNREGMYNNVYKCKNNTSNIYLKFRSSYVLVKIMWV